MVSGGLDRHDRMPTVIGLFKRDSVSSMPGSRRGSVQSLHSPRHSIGSSIGSLHEFDPHQHQGQAAGSSTPTAASRRGSVFAVSIPEEVTEETDKDLIEIESKKSSGVSSEDIELVRTPPTASASRRKDGEDKENQSEESPRHPDTDDSPHATQTKL